MKKDTSILLKKLKQYSLLAAPILALSGLADAQVVYTDIVPDKVLDDVSVAGEVYNLDLNNDGIWEVNLRHRVLGSSRLNEAIPQSAFNASSVATNVGAVGGLLYTGITSIITSATAVLGYPIVLSSGVMIDSNTPWFDLQALQFSSQGSPAYLPPLMNAFYTNSGSTLGLWVGAVNGYLPIRLTDETGNKYFGWARCDAPLNGTKLTVKDYAYQASAGVGIHAGAIGLGTKSPDDLDEALIFIFNRTLTVNFNTLKDADATIVVMNIMGQTMLSQKANGIKNQVNLGMLEPGNYIVQVNYEG